jgi:cell division septation protein DedD
VGPVVVALVVPVVVGAVVLVVVDVVVWDVVVAGPPAALVEVERDELPHPAMSATSESRTRRFMGSVVLGTRAVACHYPDGHGP